jgi:hypothetical protein
MGKIVFLYPVLFVLLWVHSVPLVFSQSEGVYQKICTPFELQQGLAHAGFYEGSQDGIIGKKTREAIRTFQESQDIKADGVCGPDTWERLSPYIRGTLVPEPAQVVTPKEQIPQEIVDHDERKLTRHELKQKLVP